MCSQNAHEERSKEKFRHVDPVGNSICYFPLDSAKAISNPHNNSRPPVDFNRNNS